MSRKLVGPLLGVLLSVLLSSISVVVARFSGGDVPSVSLLIHASASVVLLMTVLARLEELTADR